MQFHINKNKNDNIYITFPSTEIIWLNFLLVLVIALKFKFIYVIKLLIQPDPKIVKLNTSTYY